MIMMSFETRKTINYRIEYNELKNEQNYLI